MFWVNITAFAGISALASSYLFIKIALNDLHPITIAILRIGICTPIFAILLFKQKKNILKDSFLNLLLLSFLLVILPNIFLNYGLGLISAPSASLLEAIEPLYTIIFAFLLLKEKLKIKHIFSLTGALIGIYIIASKGFSINPLQNSQWQGVVWVSLSAISLGCSNLLAKKTLSLMSPLEMVSWTFIFATGIMITGCLLFHAYYDISDIYTIKIQTDSIIALLGLTLISTVGGYFLYFKALSKMQASRLAYYLFSLPLLTSIYAYTFFNQIIEPFVWKASVFIILSLIITEINFYDNFKNKIRLKKDI